MPPTDKSPETAHKPTKPDSAIVRMPQTPDGNRRDLPTSSGPHPIKQKLVEFVRNSTGYWHDQAGQNTTGRNLDTRSFGSGAKLIEEIYRLRDKNSISSIIDDYTSVPSVREAWDPNLRRMVHRRTRATNTVLTPYPKNLDLISPIYMASILAVVLERELYLKEVDKTTGQAAIQLPHPVYSNDGTLNPRYSRILRLTRKQFADIRDLIEKYRSGSDGI